MSPSTKMSLVLFDICRWYHIAGTLVLRQKYLIPTCWDKRSNVISNGLHFTNNELFKSIIALAHFTCTIRAETDIEGQIIVQLLKWLNNL